MQKHRYERCSSLRIRKIVNLKIMWSFLWEKILKEMQLRKPDMKRSNFSRPLEMLKEGVEIIDSPGLEEDDTRTRADYGLSDQSGCYIVCFNSRQIM